jgi:hypothetical protein
MISTFDILNGCCICFFGVMGSPPFSSAECLLFIMVPFSAEGSSCHFVSTRTIPIDRPFLLFPRHAFSSFQGRSFFQPCFCFFSRSCRIVSVVLAYFSRLLLPAISSLFLGKVRTLLQFLRNTAALNALFTEEGCALNALFYGGRVCIKCLVLQREKTVSWFACTHMITRIKFW